MRAFISLCFFSLLLGGCSSTPEPRTVDVQLQKSVVLSAERYAATLRAIQAGDIDKIQDDLDWWIDQAILELVFLEERYPDEDWADNQFVNSPLKARSFYRSLAELRRDYPRKHSVPLSAEHIKQIESFIEKYQ